MGFKLPFWGVHIWELSARTVWTIWAIVRWWSDRTYLAPVHPVPPEVRESARTVSSVAMQIIPSR